VSTLGRKRLLGLRALLEDVVEHGSAAVERVQRDTAGRVFTVLEAIPPVAPAARVARDVHGAVLAGVYGSIRLVNRAVGAALTVVIEQSVPDDDQVPVTR
jgi:hypothetical protein